MPIYISPQNDYERITFITTTSETGQSDSTKGNLFLAPKTLEIVTQLAPRMKDGMDSLSKNRAIRAGEVVEKKLALKKLHKYLGHLWTGIKNRVDREDLPVDVLKYYQLPISGLLPKYNPTPALILIAESVISGEANAVAAGYAPMANPSIEELTAVVTEAKKEVNDVSEADSIVDKEEDIMQKLREEADGAIKKIVADLRYFLQDEDEPSQRRIMRRYGLVFRSEKETVTEM